MNHRHDLRLGKRHVLATLLLLCGSAVFAQANTVAGEVIKIDKPAARVTLKHGEIKAMDMPPMTMSWRLQSPAMADDLAVGDRVRFVPDRINGQYTITAINKAPQ